MAVFKVKQKLIQKVIQIYWEEIDTGDQVKWESLIDRLRFSGVDDDFLDSFPSEASQDPDEWFELYEALDCSEYENQDSDHWESDIAGTTEYQYELFDSDDNQLV